MRVAKSSCVVPGADSMADVETSGATLKPGDDERYLSFVWQVMTDVYALIDFLSGRAKPSLASPQYRRHSGAAALRNPDIADASKISLLERERIEADLEHSTALVQRAMRIGKSLGAGNVSADDVSFLVSARDLLNQRAAPATGTSIVFTLLVTNKIHPKVNKSRSEEDRSDYVYTSKHLESAASQLALLLRMSLIVMFLLLSFTLAMSAYVAWGKLLLDTRDALLHDVGGNDAVFAAQVAQGPSGSLGMGDLIATACKADTRTFAIDEACKQRDELDRRREGVTAHLRSWDWGSDHSEEGVAQHVAVAVGVIGNYILPVLYGALGAMGSMLRHLNGRLADRLLTPRDRRACHIRVMLGILTGACIGLFFNSSAGPAQVTGLGGAAVTLSASAIAFLAGYGVEAVFRTLDTLLTHIFRLGEESKSTVEHPQYVAGGHP